MAVLRIAGLAGLVVLCATTSYKHPGYLSLIALAAAVYIAGSLGPDGARSPIARPVESSGIFSYEIYLFHLPVLWARGFGTAAGATEFPDFARPSGAAAADVAPE